jgi:hypothetical protein
MKTPKKRRFDLLLENGKQCRVWQAVEPVKIGQEVTGTRMTMSGITVFSGIVKEILAIDGIKQK